jgi:hypothetical protein
LEPHAGFPGSAEMLKFPAVFAAPVAVIAQLRGIQFLLSGNRDSIFVVRKPQITDHRVERGEFPAYVA